MQGVVEWFREWGTIWGALAAMASVLVAVGFGRWGVPPVARFLRGLVELSRGIASLTELPQLLPTLHRLEALDQTVSHIYREVIPNGGGSLRDAVTATREAVKRTETALTLFINSTRAQWDGMGLFAVFEAAPDGAYTYTNATYQRWALRNEHELILTGWVATIAPRDRERVRQEWESCIEDVREMSIAYAMQDAIGRQFEVLCTAVPVREAHNGPVVKWVGVIKKKEGPTL